MKKSKILKLAKQRVADGTDNYICDAISAISGPDSAVSMELKNWITELIGHRFSYCNWLEDVHPEFFKEKVYSMWPDRCEVNKVCRTGRLQWLDWMIDYWQKQGQ